MFADWQLFRRRALFIALVSIGIVAIMWNIPQLAPILWPFRLFVTFVHEAGHGLAAIITGGRFISFEVTRNGAGLATTAGGNRAVILPAGYLGSALFGALLFYITNRVPYPRTVAMGLGIGLIILSILYGISSLLALAVGVAFGLALIAISRVGNRYVNVLVLNILAIMTALNAVLDVFYLTRAPGAANGPVVNDAAAFAQTIVPGTPAVLWAVVWSFASVLMLGLSVYYSLIQPLRR